MQHRNGPTRVLWVARETDAELEQQLAENHHLIRASNGSEAMAKLAALDHPEEIGVVVSEFKLVDMSGMDLFAKLEEQLPETLRILINDAEDVELLTSAINRCHVYHYLHKPFEPQAAREALQTTVAAFEAHHQLAATAAQLKAELASKDEELASAYQLVEQATLTDSLTGLHNRGFMQHHFETELKLLERQRHETPEGEHDLLFLLADIDQFTPVNDIYGHAAGDRLLEEFSCRMQEVFRGSDILVRWGGDQFLIVARFARRDGGDAAAERLRAAMADQPFDLGKGVKLTKSCSIGFAAFPFFSHAPDIIPWTRVVNFADQARLVAKRSGRNCWVGFEPREKVEPLDAAKRILTSPEQACSVGILKVSTSKGSPSILTWD
jgi:diguanylate cyclase (GGDEF)-like protein